MTKISELGPMARSWPNSVKAINAWDEMFDNLSDDDLVVDHIEKFFDLSRQMIANLMGLEQIVHVQRAEIRKLEALVSQLQGKES